MPSSKVQNWMWLSPQVIKSEKCGFGVCFAPVLNGFHSQASNNGNFLVLSGDDGLVRLFNYPVVSRKAL
eukprot:SAG22_NODE_1978_length_3212_cov_3.220045_1_plen_68_part_10